MQELTKIMESKPEVGMRICRRAEIGTCPAHQGDVYIIAVSPKHPKGKQKSVGEGAIKVAVGENEGSNHIAVGNLKVYEGTQLPDFFNKEAPDEVLGPVVVASDTWVLKHPKHDHHTLPAGTYQVTYQLDFRTQQRVAD